MRPELAEERERLAMLLDLMVEKKALVLDVENPSLGRAHLELAPIALLGAVEKPKTAKEDDGDRETDAVRTPDGEEDDPLAFAHTEGIPRPKGGLREVGGG